MLQKRGGEGGGGEVRSMGYELVRSRNSSLRDEEEEMCRCVMEEI